jgi:hypothetical protein
VERAAVSLGVLGVAVASAALALVLMLATSAGLAVVEGGGALLDLSTGIRCMFREVWAAVVAWGIVMTAARRMNVSVTRWSVVAIATLLAALASKGDPRRPRRRERRGRTDGPCRARCATCADPRSLLDPLTRASPSVSRGPEERPR